MNSSYKLIVREELIRKQLRFALGKAQVTMGRAMLTGTKLIKQQSQWQADLKKMLVRPQKFASARKRHWKA